MKMYIPVAAAMLVFASVLSAANIVVPNGSFETPPTTLATNRIDSWQDNPKPDWWDERLYGPWDLLTGVFTNVPGSAGVPIDNMDGGQAAFLFASPGVGFFQDYNSVDWADTTPTHEFNATYRAGKAYRLTVALIGGGGNMREGVTLALALYYRDASSNMVVVSMTNVTHSVALFPSLTHFVDIPVSTPVVKASDAWANQNVGIALVSTVDPLLQGGYWDVDHVRLQEIDPPRLVTRRAGEIVVESEPGLVFEIRASSSLVTPIASWAVIGSVTNTTGTATFVDPSVGSKSLRFYIARLVP